MSRSQKPVATCDKCGKPIYYGHRPDGIPNGFTLRDCHGIPGNNVTVCADCVIAIGKAVERGGKR